MAHLPKKSITHFIHPGHQLTATDGHDQRYRCDGCKTLGTGQRYRCHGCDFELHEYCGTCPETLSSTMHQHPLTLVIRKAQSARQTIRTCDLCSDPVEGLFYRCKECDFDVHPLCTQFPNELQHALHRIHPLRLESNSLPGFCAVCKNFCKGWRYRCRDCHFDIHLECIIVPIVQCRQKPLQNAKTTQRGIPMFDQGIPFRPPPQYSGYYGYYYGYGPGHNMYNGQMYGHPVYPNNFVQQDQVAASGDYYGYGPGHNMYNGQMYGHPVYTNNFVQQNQVAAGGDYYGYGPGHNMYNGQMDGHPVYPNNFVQQNQVAAGGDYNSYGPENNMNNGQMYGHPDNFVQQNQVAAGGGDGGGGKRLAKIVFSLVSQLGIGVLSNVIFGLIFV